MMLLWAIDQKVILQIFFAYLKQKRKFKKFYHWRYLLEKNIFIKLQALLLIFSISREYNGWDCKIKRGFDYVEVE